ncbi:phosphate uptake regulator, PhoU [Methanocorpusculum labreanum Z]|uniref:Phosphate-specific transport system accessory protein PhoU n=1 Tax=Methanocorpusculum labreanum (strain ATCC 43576 / DSM 4855 / Z) TaxID=410358 RepID=A2SSH8_METLZ|nr:phosphate signaling complex protein PhoU [Methanocorpusculum labreanum]ABN07284.1 phosphate uptake regulator, PhoU [Methanocorpusculum labreanum Z]
MNTYFHVELDSYKSEVTWYGRFALTMLKNSLLAYESADLMIAADIIRQKEYVNNQYEMLNERGLLLIALNQPMAKDLRMISSCMDIVTSSERIGRYAKDITELVAASVPDKIPPALHREGEATVSILNEVYTAFESGDVSRLQGCADIEGEIDTLYASLYKEIVTAMEGGSMTIPFGSACHLVNRYLERCGDHACRMAEKVYYLQTGKRVPLEEISQQ